MANTRHKTTIEIGVDDREVAGLEKSLGRAFDQSKLDQFEKSLERIARLMDKIGGAGGGGGIGGFGSAGSPSNSVGGGGANSRGSTTELVRALTSLRDSVDQGRKEAKKGGFLQTMMGTAAGQALYGGIRGGIGGASRMGAAAASGNFLQQGMSAIPVAGPVLAAAAQSSIQLYREHAQQQMAQASAFGASGVGNMGGLVSQGVNRYGLSPGQVPGMVAQFAGQSALTGGALRGAFGTQMDLSQLLGVQGAGGIVQAGNLGGGETRNPSELMKQAVGSGLVAGIREARLDQYLQGLSSFVEEARTQGINLNPQSAMQLMNAFGATGSGFQGEAGTQFATSFGQGFSGAGRGRGFAQGLALRAAGFGTENSYQEALELIESRDPETMKRFVDSIRSQTSDTGAGSYLMRQAMEQLGVNMSAVQSRQLFESGMFVGDDAGGEAEGYGSAGEAALRGRQQDAGGVFGAGANLGRLQLRRQRMGGDPEVGGVGLRLMNSELDTMAAVLPYVTPALSELVDLVKELGDGIGSTLRTAREEGYGQAALDLINPAAGEATRRVREAQAARVREAREKDTESIQPTAEATGPTASRAGAAREASQQLAFASEALRRYADSEGDDVSAIG